MATILVVEDRATDREFMVTLLKYARHRVIEAADAVEAMRLVQVQHPDLIISDMLLPEKDGYELVRQIRSNPSAAQTPIIFYTAVFSEQEALDLARECGVTRILTKPTEPERILDTVAEVLKTKGSEEFQSPSPLFHQKHDQLLVHELIRQVDALRQSEGRVRYQNAILEAINRILREAITCETEEDLGGTCLAVVEEVTGSKFGFIGEMGDDGWLHDIAISETGWEMCTMYDQTGHRKPLGNFKIHGIYGRVMQDGKSLLTNDPSSHPDRMGVPQGHPPLKAFLGVPLLAGGKTIGMVAMGNREGGYTPEQQEALEAIAPAIVQALSRKRTEDALRQRSRELQQLTETLEQRVQERTEELAQANKALRHLSSKLLSAHENERRRIAGEIHDSIGGCLGGIKFKVESALQQIGKNPNAATESLSTILPLIQECGEECRRMQMDLRPPVLDDLGLLATLSWFCRRFQTTYSHIRIDQEIGIEEGEIPDALKIVIYRLTQEATNNIAKHSEATRVRLSLQKLDNRMELVLQDNGQGFDREEAGSRECSKRGFGLSSMKERTQLSGGSFAVESAAGKGTIIRASWPLGPVQE